MREGEIVVGVEVDEARVRVRVGQAASDESLVARAERCREFLLERRHRLLVFRESKDGSEDEGEKHTAGQRPACGDVIFVSSVLQQIQWELTAVRPISRDRM